MRGIYRYIQSDYYRYTGVMGGRFRLTLAGIFGRNRCFKYSFWLRLASTSNFITPLAKFMHNHYSVKYGLDIPRTTKIGYGLYIGHGIGAVINPLTKIGNNCNISQHYCPIKKGNSIFETVEL